MRARLTPQVRLLDARKGSLDRDGLRQWAHETTARASHASRSYRYPYALVAWHHEPVGIDLERIATLDTGFAQLICTAAEHRQLAEAAEPNTYLSSLWCAKEALTKALGEPLRYDPRRVEAPLVWPTSHAGPWRAHPLDAPDGHVAWLVWRDSDPAQNEIPGAPAHLFERRKVALDRR